MTTTTDAGRALGELTLPALGHLATAIDREFARRDPRRTTAIEFAAARLGLRVHDLAVATEGVEPPVAHAVGVWLLAAQKRHGADHVGADPNVPASLERVPGAGGDVRAFRAVSIVLPRGVLHETAVVVRLVPERFGTTVELIGAREHAAELADAFAAFLRERRTTDSPYRLGSYRVATDNAGLVLKRWTLPAASRDLLKLDASVWSTIDTHVHLVLTLAEDLKARGLGTSTGLLLVGPPGTGKTQLGTVVATELAGSATVLVPGGYVTEHYLTDLFDLAADLSPCLILMDDLDLVAGVRGQTQPHRLREFLNVMDGGLADRAGVVVIASTNDHRKIDKAAQRSSRFDTVIKMEAPSLEGRLAILERYLAWSDADLDLTAVARVTGGATGADLKELVRGAVLATRDRVSTQALLAQAATGPWRADAEPVGDYL